MKNKLFFLIFTSSKKLTLAFFSEKNLIQKKEILIEKNLTEILIVEIKKFFSNAKKEIEDVSEIYIPLGPGTYTNDRVIGVFTKTLGVIFTDLHIFTIDRFLWFSNFEKKTLVALNANKKNYFVAGCLRGKIEIPPELVSHLKLKYYSQKHSEFKLVFEEDFSDLKEIFFSLKPFFKKKSWKKVSPYSL